MRIQPVPILAVIFSLLLLFPFVSAQSRLSRTTYNCTDGILMTNKSSWVAGEFIDQFSNETCPGGCATNGEECNSPLNVDKFGVSIAAAIFLAAAAFFFVLSNNIKTHEGATIRVIKAFHTLKYLHLLISFMCVLFSLLLLSSMYMAGQNELTSYILGGWYIILLGVIMTFVLLFFSEVDMWVQKLKDLGKRSI